MFYGCKSLTDVSNLKIKKVNRYRCCESMFSSCSNLRIPMETLPSSMGSYGYANMFANCTSLEKTPTFTFSMNSSTADGSYFRYMFYNCKSLTDASNITIKGVGKHSCYSMFENCTNLITPPVITSN